ncbi:MAG TPA: hypothetical protein VG845_07920, partial [Dehalococcoidia bacterium]|nr:hypothetical protein [Dehalococcoidia bacterium]
MISGIGDPGRLLIVGVALASCFAMVAAGVVVAASGEASEQGYLTLVCVPSAVFGGLVSIKQPRNPIGWILLAIAFFFPLQLVSGSYLEAHPD